MEQNFYINHRGNNVDECYAACPAEHGPMLKVLHNIMQDLACDHLEGETKKGAKLRRGFSYGMLSGFAIRIGEHDELELLQKPSGLVEAILKVAHDEVSLMAWVDMVYTKILKKKETTKINLRKIDKKNGDKVATITLNDDGTLNEEDLVGLPQKVQDAVRAEVKKRKEELK